MRRLPAALMMTLALVFGACSNSDAGGDDTQPRNNTEDQPQGDAPGSQPGGSDSQGEGTGTGRGD